MILERLDLSSCYKLNYIDPSIGNLQHLIYLTFDWCTSLDELPELLGELHALRDLSLRETSITRLPNSIGRLEKLERLNLSGCRSLVNLPQSFGELHALQDLNLKETSITHLPNCIGRLEKLELLNLSECQSLVYLPLRLGNLRSLVRLKIRGTKINRFPAFRGRLEKLQKLDLRNSQVSQLPSVISHSLLQSLDLSGCHQLRELTDLPPSLTKLIVDSDELNKVADLSKLQNLTYLKIVSRCAAMLEWNGSFPSNCKLRTLIVRVFNISRLPDLTCCSELTHLELECKYSLKVLPNISGLRKLVRLNIVSCLELKEIPGIQKLQCLTSLHIKDCPSLQSLENLRGLQALEELKLISCGKLIEIPGLGELRGLSRVDIRICHSLERIDNLIALKQLEAFWLMDCPLLTEIPGLGGLLTLVSLYIVKIPSLLSLENLQGLQLLKDFMFARCQRITEIPGLDKLRCSDMLVIHKKGDFLVVFGRKKESYNSNSVEEAVKEEDISAAVHPVTKDKVVEIGGEVVVCQLREDVCRKQQSPLTRSSVLVLNSHYSIMSSDGSRSFPISGLEGKVVALYFAPSCSFSFIKFTLDLLDVHEKLKTASSETAFEIVCVHLRDDDQPSFWQSFGSLPWLSLHPSCLNTYTKLCMYFNLSPRSTETEPTLVIVGEDGRVLNFNAVNLIKVHGARAYPFTLERFKQIMNSNEEDNEPPQKKRRDNEELVMEANMLWPKKLQHHLHIHQLVPTLRQEYICKCCYQKGKFWSYCCEECDFDLHCRCASTKNINTTEQSSILEEGDLQSLENLMIDAEGNDEDMQGQLLDLHNRQDDASCSEHVNLDAEQSFVSSDSQHGRTFLAWSCCLPFLSFFRS